MWFDVFGLRFEKFHSHHRVELVDFGCFVFRFAIACSCGPCWVCRRSSLSSLVFSSGSPRTSSSVNLQTIFSFNHIFGTFSETALFCIFIFQPQIWVIMSATWVWLSSLPRQRVQLLVCYLAATLLIVLVVIRSVFTFFFFTPSLSSGVF